MVQKKKRLKSPLAISICVTFNHTMLQLLPVPPLALPALTLSLSLFNWRTFNRTSLLFYFAFLHLPSTLFSLIFPLARTKMTLINYYEILCILLFDLVEWEEVETSRPRHARVYFGHITSHHRHPYNDTHKCRCGQGVRGWTTEKMTEKWGKSRWWNNEVRFLVRL